MKHVEPQEWPAIIVFYLFLRSVSFHLFYPDEWKRCCWMKIKREKWAANQVLFRRAITIQQGWDGHEGHLHCEQWHLTLLVHTHAQMPTHSPFKPVLLTFELNLDNAVSTVGSQITTEIEFQLFERIKRMKKDKIAFSLFAFKLYVYFSVIQWFSGVPFHRRNRSCVWF